jgi:methionyl-tRNA formyltransferase
MRIAVAGSGRLGFSLVQPLMDSAHDVVAILQDGRKTRGVKRSLIASCGFLFEGPGSAMWLAARAGIPAIWIDRMDEAELALLRRLDPDVLLVGGFSIIFKKALLGLPKVGCINTHSSLLPKHRGPNPYAAAILAGDTESGVTFHIMDAGIDTGDILEQHAFPIEPRDTSLTIYTTSCDLAGRRVAALMDRVEREGLHGRPQDNAAASYEKKLEKKDAGIDWNRPALYLERLSRACKPFFLMRFRHRRHTVIVSQARCDETPVDAAPGTVIEARPWIRVATGRGSLTILMAYAAAPVPWVWPAPWDRPKPGDKMG